MIILYYPKLRGYCGLEESVFRLPISKNSICKNRTVSKILMNSEVIIAKLRSTHVIHRYLNLDLSDSSECQLNTLISL